MAFQLVGISGEHKGSSWTIDEEGLVIGRSTGCDVAVLDPSVSRRHCRVYWRDGELRIQDLGSRSPVLVNGVPVKDGVLRVKDEIAVGTEIFLVGNAHADAGSAGRDTGDKVKTASWSDAEPVALQQDLESGTTDDRPRTVADLLALHETTRLLGRASTMPELTAILIERLRERFDPQHVWLARVHGQEGLTFYPADPPGGDPGAGAPIEVIREALVERRGLLAPQTRRPVTGTVPAFALVAPVTLGSDPVGVIALQTEPPHGAYKEADLRMLVLMADALAPFIHAVEVTGQLRRDYERLRARAGESHTLVGKSRAMRHVRTQVAKAARGALHVLITGETGTGKELAARSVHAGSDRHDKPFIVVNCAAIPRDLFESQLFGYEKGAFTGAERASPGLMAQAHGGMLFLDEVGDLSLDNQARILRAIETGVFRGIGAEDETRVDVRVVAATNKDLRDSVARGAFRNDLYHRLNGFEIHIPPLREHPSDIPVLAGHFFEMGKDQIKRPLEGIAPDAMHYLCSCKWPGNVRQLRNTLLRAISVASETTVQLNDVLAEDRPLPEETSRAAPLSLVEAEKGHIASVLRHCQGDVREAAKVLEVSRSTLYRKMATYGLQ